MATHPSDDTSAVRIAARLRRRAGARAWGEADDCWRRAKGTGDIATADLYRAVCTILGDRDGVFTQSRRPAIGRIRTER